MLVLKCARCKRKLWKYDKIGQGEVLRCLKARITKNYLGEFEQDRVTCACGNTLGLDKGRFIKMIAKAFTYSGTKRN